MSVVSNMISEISTGGRSIRIMRMCAFEISIKIFKSATALDGTQIRPDSDV